MFKKTKILFLNFYESVINSTENEKILYSQSGILLGGILKRTQKTPQKEIDKAEEIRKQYLENKQK